MSKNRLCDVCNRKLYELKDYMELTIRVRNRYRPSEPSEYQLDLCDGCDMKVAKALRKLLPLLAQDIEPNVGNTP